MLILLYILWVYTVYILYDLLKTNFLSVLAILLFLANSLKHYNSFQSKQFDQKLKMNFNKIYYHELFYADSAMQ